MKRIGLMSDTHSYLDPKILKYFKDVDEIWHAGDIGSTDVLDSLRKIKTVRAVYGNIDNHEIRVELNEFENFKCEEVNVLMTHIGGRPGKYSRRLAEIIRQHSPDLFICGHSHILLVKHDPSFGMLCMNPGACGNHGFHPVKTLLRFSISGSKIHDLEVIEIGNR